MALRVLIAGGGTGGHVIPALAIGRELRNRHGAEVRFVGTARGLETRLVPEAGFALELVQVGQLNNVSLRTRLETLTRLPSGVLRCLRLLREFKPDVVIGVGGYASGPAMMAAILRRVPTLAFEPNAIPGLVNRMVGRYVNLAAVNFEETRRYFKRAQVTGIPVRAEFFAIPLHTFDRREHTGLDGISREPGRDAPPHLLVFGGSQGAQIFNEVMPLIAKRLLDRVPELTMLHQAGARSFESTFKAYQESGADPQRWRVEAFVDDMPKRFADADLILCRSGASTIAELAAAGRAAVLVPFPGAADDHQLRNAEAFAAEGAAQVRPQADAPAMKDLLFSDLSELLTDAERRNRMEQKARELARPEALGKIAEMCLKLAEEGRT